MTAACVSQKDGASTVLVAMSDAVSLFKDPEKLPLGGGRGFKLSFHVYHFFINFYYNQLFCDAILKKFWNLKLICVLEER